MAVSKYVIDHLNRMEAALSEPIEGELFRRNYLREASRLPDSERARRRVAALLDSRLSGSGLTSFARLVHEELGIDFPYTYNHYDNIGFWLRTNVSDFLSGITLSFRLLRMNETFLTECRKIFEEEVLRYRIDDKGGVHYLVDEEFERNVASTIAELGTPRFEGARTELEGALRAFGIEHQSGKALIRGVFEAVETAFLVVTRGGGKAKILNERSIDALLKPMLLKSNCSPSSAWRIAGEGLTWG
jgi:hypothetical protein